MFIDTAGYGKEGKAVKAIVHGGENEQHVNYTPLSCVPIIQDNEDDIKLVRSRVDPNITNLDDLWGEILGFVYERDEENSYNTINNNCCTLAYELTEELIGKEDALRIIEPDSFNGGMGITQGKYIGSCLGKIWAIFRFVKQNPIATTTAVVTIVVTIGTRFLPIFRFNCSKI